MLWSAPRSISTAFERAFMQRSDTVTLHEPFGDAYYFGPERLSNRFTEEKCATSDARDLSYPDVHRQIMQAQANAGSKLVFVKDMAQYIVPPKLAPNYRFNPSVLSDEDLKTFRHTFLVRTPQKTLESYYRTITTVDCGDFGAFDPTEAGFFELRALMEYIRHLLPEEPLVLVDSADLIAQPERTLRAFCSAVGITFDPNMLSWDVRRVSSFDKWKGFHDQAQNSTGFQDIPRKEVKLPQSVLDAIDVNMPIYEYLRELKLEI